MNRYQIISFILCLGGALLYSPAETQAKSFTFREADQCSLFFARYEHKFDLPDGILKAISIRESGRWSHRKQAKLPWPWTVNVDGKGYYFHSKQSAIKEVNQMIRRGVNNIDVGCMQISRKYHKDAFRNLNQLFEPKYNIAYAAKLLRDNYNQTENWERAIADYHSKHTRRGSRYAKRVIKIWDEHTGVDNSNHYEQPPLPVTKASIFLSSLRN